MAYQTGTGSGVRGCSLEISETLLDLRMKQKQLTVTYKRTEDLIPYVNNARTHSDEQVTQIASSIKEFGFNNPILTDGENGVIAGHGRLLAAKKLGLETVPTIELSGLTKAQKKAYILADNKIALNSGWDIDLLSVELQELQDTDLAPVTGFSAEELNTLLSETTEPAEEEEPEEEEPEEDSFNLTLSIPIEYKEQVQDFVKSFGPEDLIQKIIDMTS